MLTAVPPCAGGRENFINAFAALCYVIEQVRKERPQDYLKVAAVLLPKQMEIETARTRPLSELTDAELMSSMLDGSIDLIVESILISRGHRHSPQRSVSSPIMGARRLSYE